MHSFGAISAFVASRTVRLLYPGRPICAAAFFALKLVKLRRLYAFREAGRCFAVFFSRNA